MEEFEASHTTPLPGANGGEQASADQRFAGIRQAARSSRMNAKRVNGDATAARLEGMPAGQLRLCLPLLGRFYLIRVGPAVKTADRQADTDARVRVMLLAANVVIGFIAAVAATVYAISGDAPFVYMARETGFFLLRQISVVRDLIGGILSFSLF
jgi:hypothetical protein